MYQENKKVISIRLIYVILLFAVIIGISTISIKYYKEKRNEKLAKSFVVTTNVKPLQLAVSREERSQASYRSEVSVRANKNVEIIKENLTGNNESKIVEENNKTQITEEVEENTKQETKEEEKEGNIENTESAAKEDKVEQIQETTEENVEQNNVETVEDSKEQDNKIEEKNSETKAESESKKYISISQVKISQGMDLTVRTGLSRADFIKLISGVKQDTSGFFKQNAGKIYDLCEKYSINEIFFCGIISAESGWNIAQNHRNTHNYISLISNGKLISYATVDEGLTVAAQKLHTNYLTPGGKFYHGKTLAAVKTNFCPASSTWVSLVYGRMQQIIK